MNPVYIYSLLGIAFVVVILQAHWNKKTIAELAVEISAKADQIHDLTNSRMAAMDRKLAESAETIQDLEKILQAWRDLKPVDPDHAPEERRRHA